MNQIIRNGFRKPIYSTCPLCGCQYIVDASQVNDIKQYEIYPDKKRPEELIGIDESWPEVVKTILRELKERYIEDVCNGEFNEEANTICPNCNIRHKLGSVVQSLMIYPTGYEESNERISFKKWLEDNCFPFGHIWIRREDWMKLTDKYPNILMDYWGEVLKIVFENKPINK